MLSSEWGAAQYQQAMQYYGGNGELIARTGVEDDVTNKPATVYYTMVNQRLFQQEYVRPLQIADNDIRSLLSLSDQGSYTLSLSSIIDKNIVRPFYAGNDVIASYEHHTNAEGTTIKDVLINITRAPSINITQFGNSRVSEELLRSDRTMTVSPEFLSSMNFKTSMPLYEMGEIHIDDENFQAAPKVNSVLSSFSGENEEEKANFTAALDYYLLGKSNTSIDFESSGAQKAKKLAEEIQAERPPIKVTSALKAQLAGDNSYTGPQVWDKLAMAAYQDSSLGLFLAQENGCSYSEVPTLGMEIKIPPILRNTYAANISVAYQEFVGTLIKGLYPHMITPEHHRPFWDKILRMVVAIAATIVTIFHPELVPYIAIAAGITEAGVEAIEVIAKERQHIDFGEVLLTTAVTYLGGRIGAINNAAAVQSMFSNLALSIGSAAIIAAVENAIVTSVSSQLVAMSLGLRQGFDFKEVAAQALAALAMAKIKSSGLITNAKVTEAVSQLNMHVALSVMTGRSFDVTQTLCDMMQATVIQSVIDKQDRQVISHAPRVIESAAHSLGVQPMSYTPHQMKHTMDKDNLNEGMRQSRNHSTTSTSSENIVERHDVHNIKTQAVDANGMGKKFSQLPMKPTLAITWDEVNGLAKLSNPVSDAKSHIYTVEEDVGYFVKALYEEFTHTLTPDVLAWQQTNRAYHPHIARVADSLEMGIQQGNSDIEAGRLWIGKHLPGTEWGAEAARYWAHQYAMTGNPLCVIPGVLASLWTPETAMDTLSVIPAVRSLSGPRNVVGLFAVGNSGAKGSSLSQMEYLTQKYGPMTSQERMARIDELAGQNLKRRFDTTINSEDMVYRYLSHEGLQKSLETGYVRGYTTTLFSSSSREVARGTQILPEWGTPEYGVAIPTDKLAGFRLARPFGNTAEVGWEPYTNSYPVAGPGHWPQFLIDPVSIDDVYIYRLKR